MIFKTYIAIVGEQNMKTSGKCKAEKSSMIPCIAVTIDVEWVPSVIIEKMIDELARHKIPATLFCTDEPSLTIPSIHETALHPNFRGMDDWNSTLEKLQKMYPKACGFRSHCLHSDTRLVRLMSEKNFAYQSNVFAPGQGVAPFLRETGLWEIPIHYMDDFHIRRPEAFPHGFKIESLPQNQKLVVVDFHPIPWFINAEKAEDYEKAKVHYKDPVALEKMRRQGSGVASLFSALIKEITLGKFKAVTLSEIVCMLDPKKSSLSQWPNSLA